MIPGFAFPFLICDESEIDQDHIGWRHPNDEDNYAKNNLINDLKLILCMYGDTAIDDETMDATIDALFSTVKSFVCPSETVDM